ncbi:hypothetical protein Syun_021221 [Stephania yunnanensis]|uniref:Uncharacterized protein n=1 Tax=Stephania yunnanensis TaxID=152371 RepID=A0AAP0IF99_9MAGN
MLSCFVVMLVQPIIAMLLDLESTLDLAVGRVIAGLYIIDLVSFTLELPRSFTTNSSETPPTVNELYLHLHTVNHDEMTFIDTRSERFYATPDQPVDDEVVYLNVAGECPRGRVYGLGSLGRKKRKYADPGVSTSQMPKMVPRAEFDIVADQLRKGQVSRTRVSDWSGCRLATGAMTSSHSIRNEMCFIRAPLISLIRDILAMSRLQELKLSLAHKCLSFDFVGTSLDESSEEFGTVQIYEDLNSAKPTLKILYVTPELIATTGFMPKLKKVYNRGLLNLIAIDELACFGCIFSHIASLHGAMTSAKESKICFMYFEVRKDVIESLCLENPVVLRSSFNRPNIFYEATKFRGSVAIRSDPLLIRDGLEKESNNSVYDPLLISDGSETDLLDSVSDPLLIRDGSETKLLDSVSDPLLIKDGSKTKLLDSVSNPLLIRDGSETECNYNCTLLKNFHFCSVSGPLLNSVSNPSLINNGNTFPLLIESATTSLETE